MPAMQWAAFPSTADEMRLTPATSATLYIMVTSLHPTYGPTSPDAMVDTITLGKPTGSDLKAGAMRAVSPDPPIPIMPENSPRCAAQ